MNNNSRFISNIRLKNYVPTRNQQLRMPIETPASFNLSASKGRPVVSNLLDYKSELNLSQIIIAKPLYRITK